MVVYPVTCTMFNPDGSRDVCIIDEVFSNRQAALDHIRYMVSVSMEYEALKNGFTEVKELPNNGQVYIYYSNGRVAELWEIWKQEVYDNAESVRQRW